MSQFRPFPQVQTLDDTASDQAQYRLQASAITPPATLPAQFPTTIEPRPEVRTGALTNGTAALPVISTEQLAAIAGGRVAAPATDTRIVRIPGGSRKAPAVTEPLAKPHKRMSPRLRHSIIISCMFFVTVFTLLSLSPLASGQNGLPLFKGIGSWVRSQQQSFLQLESQIVQVTQSQKSTSQQVNLPPVNLPKSAYIAIAQQDAANAGISPNYFVRQINLESGFNPNAVSPSGAEGIAQFLPSTAAELGINPFDPYQALNAAAHVMAGYNANYHGNYAMALAAYNAGSGTVQYAVNTCGSNWMSCLPPETQNYIYVIMGI